MVLFRFIRLLEINCSDKQVFATPSRDSEGGLRKPVPLQIGHGPRPTFPYSSLSNPCPLLTDTCINSTTIYTPLPHMVGSLKLVPAGAVPCWREIPSWGKLRKTTGSSEPEFAIQRGKITGKSSVKKACTILTGLINAPGMSNQSVSQDSGRSTLLLLCTQRTKRL